MNQFWTVVLGFVACVLIFGYLWAFRGMSQVPRLGEMSPAADADCSMVSVLFAARDEATKLPQALPTMLAQDYPRYEVVAVNDRSGDATPQILDEFARKAPKLKVVHLAELPPSWLGKPHALAIAFQHALGDWLVFTDADVRFAPDLLRRTVALAQARQWDHLSLLAIVELKGFWEKVAVTFWTLGFVMTLQPWRVSNPKTGSYAGVGAFQLLRRSAYEAIGTHRRLALEVVDDMRLGALVKRGGFRSGVALSEDLLGVRWQEGLGNVIHGLTKNTFAALDYSVVRVGVNILGLLVFYLLPVLGVVFGTGIARLLAASAVAVQAVAHGTAARSSRASPLYGLTFPLGALLFIYILLRSTIVTVWRGGVLWRGTFYPLDELKHGRV